MCPPSLLAGRFSADLLLDELGEHSPAFGFQQGHGVETTEYVQDKCRQTRPSRLVAGSQPGAVVTVKIFVEQDQIAPMRIFLELGRAAINRPLSVGIAQENA